MEVCAPHFMDEIMRNPIFEVQTMVRDGKGRLVTVVTYENFEGNPLRGVF